MNLLLIPLFAVANRLRGMDSVGKIPASILIGLGTWPLYDWQTALICSIGFFIWSVPAWYPRDNWSATDIHYLYSEITGGKNYWLKWYGWTVLHQLWMLPLFVSISVYLTYKLGYFVYIPIVWSLIPILSWGALMYILSPNCLNFKQHTVWHEVLFGGIIGFSILCAL